jgi:hypothetical protein
MKNAVFWDVAPCRSFEFNRRLGRTCSPHLQGRKIRERETSVSSLLPPTHAGSSLADFSTLKMEAKRRFTQDLHGATSQKTAFFIVTAVKTSNPKKQIQFPKRSVLCVL